MTRKDYKIIAECIKKTVDLYREEDSIARIVVLSDFVGILAGNFSTQLEKDNPRFDRSKFIEAILG